MAKEFDVLKELANVIKNEVEDGANTASRVGGMFVDVVEKIQDEHIDVVQELGDDEKAVVSQKAVTNELIEDFLQRNNSTFNNVLNDNFEIITLPPFSLWGEYTLSPTYDGGYSTILQNAPFLATTTDHWISLPLHGYLKSDAKYIGIIQEMFIKKPLESGNIRNNACIKSTVGNINYVPFTEIKSLHSGRKLLYIGYINVEKALEYEDLLLCCTIHSNAEHDEIEVQLSGLRLFYIENIEDIDKITIEDITSAIKEDITEINQTIENNETIKEKQFAGIFSSNNLFDGLDITNQFLNDEGQVSTEVDYQGYLTDYVAVCPGDVLFLNMYSYNSSYDMIWGYKEIGGLYGAIKLQVEIESTPPISDPLLIQRTLIIPENSDVKYIRAATKVMPDGSMPQCILTSSLKYLVHRNINLANTLKETRSFLVVDGVGSDVNYVGYITDYIPVKAGERYYVKGAFPYIAENMPSNIYVYKDKNNTDILPLGDTPIQKVGEHRIVKIPDGYNYLRVCAKKEATPHFAVIKIDDIFNQISAALTYQYLLDFEAQIDDYIKQVYTKISKLNLENINNGQKTILSNINYLRSASVIIEKDAEDNRFTYRYSGIGNSWATTELFYPSGNNPIIISFDVEMESGGNGIKAGGSLVIGNSFVVQQKFKHIAYFNTDGHIKIEVDTSYLIVHEDFTDGFSIWFNNQSIPDYTGDEDYVSYKVSNFEVYENIDSIKSSNISGDNAKQLFESVDDNLTDIKSQLSEFDSTRLVSPSGNKYRMSVTDSGEIVTIPLIPNKGAFFGNSLITGFVEYGMAASQATKDWYYLVTTYLKTINSSFVAKQRHSATKFEGLTDVETANATIQEIFLNNLDGDENLVIVQLGDNVNTDEKNVAFHTTCAMALKAIRQKCPKARVVWIGMWYASTEKYNVIKQACEDTGCEYVFFDGLNDSSAQNVIGGKTYHESSASRSITGVTEVIENSSTNITVKFTAGGETSYETTMDVDSYTPLSGTTLQYVGHYEVIQSYGVASHPGDEGFRRIANRVLYELGYSETEETYPAE